MPNYRERDFSWTERRPVEAQTAVLGRTWRGLQAALPLRAKRGAQDPWRGGPFLERCRGPSRAGVLALQVHGMRELEDARGRGCSWGDSGHCTWPSKALQNTRLLALDLKQPQETSQSRKLHTQGGK